MISFNSALFLSDFGLSKTPIREEILSILYCNEEALSPKEIEEQLSNACDRVTLYRTIKLFEEKILIHKIVLEDQTIKYKLINPEKGVHHPHFHCLICDKVVCLPDTPLPSCSLPEGFSSLSQSTILEGKCKRCNK